jgi:arsenate reductase (thioredoxin)
MATALFVCLHNAGRSQISAALFERAAAGRHHALSAGSHADPDGRVHPQVVEVMRELDIDLADRRPQRLTPALAEAADVEVRSTRDEIAHRVTQLLDDLNATPSSPPELRR